MAKRIHQMDGVSNGACYFIQPELLRVEKDFNPRKDFDENVRNLKASIRKQGVLTPLKILKPRGKEELILIDGECRLRAVKELLAEDNGFKLPKGIPCTVTTEEDPIKRLLMAVAANEGKRLTPIEEADAFIRMRDEAGMNADAIAEATGKSRRTVFSRMNLGNACLAVRSALANKGIRLQVAEKIVKMYKDDPKAQVEALRDAIEKAKAAEEVKLVTSNDPKPVSESDAVGVNTQSGQDVELDVDSTPHPKYEEPDQDSQESLEAFEEAIEPRTEGVKRTQESVPETTPSILPEPEADNFPSRWEKKHNTEKTTSPTDSTVVGGAEGDDEAFSYSPHFCISARSVYEELLERVKEYKALANDGNRELDAVHVEGRVYALCEVLGLEAPDLID